MKTRLVRIVLSLLLPLSPAAAATVGAPIEIAVSNVASAKGYVHVDICTQPLFLTSDCVYFTVVPARIGTTTVVVPNVPPGRYAAQVFQDLNGNGKIDRGLFGIPKEPVGFSNDAPIHMAPPRWDAAAFTHGTQPQQILLKLRTTFF